MRSFAALVTCTACIAATTQTSPTTASVLDFLNRSITWYQRVNAVQQAVSTPENTVLQDNVRASSRRALQLSFAFAHAAAELLEGQNSSAAPDAQNRTLEQTIAAANQRVARIQNEIDRLNRAIERTSATARKILMARRNALEADLNLAKEQQDAMKNFASFVLAPGQAAAGGLLAQIQDLENSGDVPAALNANAANRPARGAGAPAFRPEAAGIVTLSSLAATLAGARSQMDSLASGTSALASSLESLKAPLRTALRNSISQGDALAQAVSNDTNPADIEAARTQIDALGIQFKQLSAAMTPLGELGIVLETSRTNILQWRSELDRQYGTTLRYLAVRAGILVLAIVIVLMFGEAWERAARRYVREARRRRQFILVRRFVVAFAIVLIISLGFFTSFSSVATIVGFMTAGLALALQNVILSVVAYFFLMGRFGLRVGDRVACQGVTGQVIEIGLVRFFLIELIGAGVDVHSTGRVVVFANSIIFQPYPLIRQAPGTEYVWHAVSLTVTPDIDCEAVRARVTAAVEAVYDRYRKAIESQHESFERAISLQLTPPRPVSHVRLSDNGCEISVRFPVEIQAATETDREVLEAVRSEIASDAKLQVVPGGAPRLQALV